MLTAFGWDADVINNSVNKSSYIVAKINNIKIILICKFCTDPVDKDVIQEATLLGPG